MFSVDAISTPADDDDDDKDQYKSDNSNSDSDWNYGNIVRPCDESAVVSPGMSIIKDHTLEWHVNKTQYKYA